MSNLRAEKRANGWTLVGSCEFAGDDPAACSFTGDEKRCNVKSSGVIFLVPAGTTREKVLEGSPNRKPRCSFQP